MANSKSRALVPAKKNPLQETSEADYSSLTPAVRFSGMDPTRIQELLSIIHPPTDFALIPKQGFRGVEPTRDLTLKLLAFFGYSIDTQIVEKAVEEKKLGKMTESTKRIVRYTVKAVVSDPRSGRSASGHGICGTDGSSINTAGREDHDALSVAETRAIKRAIEGLCGLPLINQLILHYYGKFTLRVDEANEVNKKFTKG